MNAIVILGQEVDADPARLREIANQADALTDELARLDPVLLTPLTLSRSPGYIARRLRSVAALIERKQRGEPGFSDIFEVLPPEIRQEMFRNLDKAARRQAARDMRLES